MAFLIEDQENPNAPQNNPEQNAPVASGGAGVGGASKPASTPGVNVPAQPSAQLSAYLKANAPQAAAFGQDVAQTVGGQVNAAGQAIPQAVNTYTGGLYSVPTDPNVNAAVAASPSGLTAEQKAAYQKGLGAAAASPNSANTFETTSGYQDAAGKIQKAVSQADLWNSGNNVSNLTAALSPFEGQNATGGARTLDALLLSRTPQAYGQIREAVKPAEGFAGQLASGTEAANTKLRETIAQNQATTDASNKAAKDYAGNLNQTLAQYLTEAQKKVVDYNNTVNPVANNLANVQPQIAALQNAIDLYNSKLASPAGEAGGSWGGNSSGSFSPISYGDVGQVPQVIGMPDVSQLATSGQYSDLAALRELLGDSSFSGLNTAVNPDQADLAGTWNPQTDASLPSLSSLVDPLTSTAIQSLNPNWSVASSMGQSDQAATPAVQDIRSIQLALDALLSAVGQQPYVGPGNSNTAPPTAPPTTATPPAPGQPASEAWYNYLMATYPGLSGMPNTYQGYLDQFNSAGIGVAGGAGGTSGGTTGGGYHVL